MPLQLADRGLSIFLGGKWSVSLDFGLQRAGPLPSGQGDVFVHGTCFCSPNDRIPLIFDNLVIAKVASSCELPLTTYIVTRNFLVTSLWRVLAWLGVVS